MKDTARLKAGALVVGADGLFVRRGEELGALALRHRGSRYLPRSRLAAGGALTSYGASSLDGYRA